MQVLGIDGGNFETKIVHESGHDFFDSSISDWNPRKIKEVHSKLDMEFEIISKYDHYKGFCGPLATIESEFGGRMFGVTKNHQDAFTRILLAIWRNISQEKVAIVIGQPYGGHNDLEKQEMIASLLGSYKVFVNGVMKEFEIVDVKVGIEGAMAFISNPTDGPVNLIDVGSGTVNCIHFLNKRIVDRKCQTLPFGSETSKNGKNFEGMSSAIFKQMSAMWNKNDKTFICGGSAKEMVGILQKYYPFAKLLDSKMTINGIKISVDPKYANAIGMYNTGVKVYGQLQTR